MTGICRDAKLFERNNLLLSKKYLDNLNDLNFQIFALKSFFITFKHVTIYLHMSFYALEKLRR